MIADEGRYLEVLYALGSGHNTSLEKLNLFDSLIVMKRIT